ncbi:MAG: DUF1365 domain-containing protein [Myxococcota bacterium]|nr:DUF1365 domain-containing protein [Myxococcota bacterium]
MRSALYEGVVRHRRLVAPAHALAFRGTWLYLDLEEAGRAFRGRWLWGVDRPALASVRRRDHLPDREGPLAEAVRDLVAEQRGRRPRGRVGLLTMTRFAGLGFNPVSFFYCWDAQETGLDAVVAEVTNTPWHERHAYVLRGDGEPVLRDAVPKDFHVSPFLPMDLEHRFRFRAPGRSLGAVIQNRRGGRLVFEARLALRRRELGTRALAGALVRRPFQPLRALASIYVHALRLSLRRAPFHPHPNPTPRARASVPR